MAKIRIYTAKHCQPCKEMEVLAKKLEEEGGADQIELIDIETDEGFKMFTEEVLSHGDGAVPSIYKDGQQCKLGFDEEGELGFECPEEEPEPEPESIQ